MEKNQLALLFFAVLTVFPVHPQNAVPPWNGGASRIDGVSQEAVLIWSPVGELHCVTVTDGRLAAWKTAGADASPLLPAALDPSVTVFSGCRDLSVHRRNASGWQVFFIAVLDGREGIHALGFDAAGNLASVFQAGFDRDSMTGPVGAYEVRQADWDSFAVFYLKGGELGYSLVEKESRTILKEAVSPPGMRLSTLTLQGIPDGSGTAFLGVAEGQDGSGTGGVLLFETRGAYPSAPEFLPAPVQSVPMTARMMVDRNGVLSCIMQNGGCVRVLRRAPGGWTEDDSLPVPFGSFTYLPLQPPMDDGAFVLSVESGTESLHGVVRDAIGNRGFPIVAGPCVPGSICPVPLDPGTLLVGWNRPMPDAGFSVVRYKTSDGGQCPLDVALPDGHRFLDAALTMDRGASPMAVLLTDDGVRIWVLRYLYDAEAGGFKLSDRRSLPRDDAAGCPPVRGCARVGNAFVIHGTSGLILLDERSGAAAAFPGMGRTFRADDGSAWLLLDDHGSFSVLRLKGSEE